MLAILKGDGTRNGKDFVCRKLKLIGTEASVPTLTGMLGDENHSHMARYALESMDNDAAGKALRDAAATLNGPLRVGVIGSLGVRQDGESAPMLANLVGTRTETFPRRQRVPWPRSGLQMRQWQ